VSNYTTPVRAIATTSTAAATTTTTIRTIKKPTLIVTFAKRTFRAGKE
jgi:hypothetical protein